MTICSVGGGNCNETDDSDLSDDGNILNEDACSEAYASDNGARINFDSLYISLVYKCTL